MIRTGSSGSANGHPIRAGLSKMQARCEAPVVCLLGNAVKGGEAEGECRLRSNPWFHRRAAGWHDDSVVQITSLEVPVEEFGGESRVNG